jgi:hypothetical protein
MMGLIQESKNKNDKEMERKAKTQRMFGLGR